MEDQSPGRHMSLELQRKAEIAKYERLYSCPDYGMGERRLSMAIKDLESLNIRGSLLDVGCGRGELMYAATWMDFGPVRGVEVVSSLLSERIRYGEATDLPFPKDSFDVVTMLDVLEHLIPGDERLAVLEAARVARQHLLCTANSRDSDLSDYFPGERAPLHINKRSTHEWDRLLRSWLPHARVIRLNSADNPARWRIDL